MPVLWGGYDTDLKKIKPTKWATSKECSWRTKKARAHHWPTHRLVTSCLTLCLVFSCCHSKTAKTHIYRSLRDLQHPPGIKEPQLLVPAQVTRIKLPKCSQISQIWRGNYVPPTHMVLYSCHLFRLGWPLRAPLFPAVLLCIFSTSLLVDGFPGCNSRNTCLQTSRSTSIKYW